MSLGITCQDRKTVHSVVCRKPGPRLLMVPRCHRSVARATGSGSRIRSLPRWKIRRDLTCQPIVRASHFGTSLAFPAARAAFRR